ncbi:hypothetical protein SteCoe_28589 [Stentor coeruleus]|uniref:Uncharacterized protein n=1 Tax=Stentor coeruleus TaxID=5963 RepID=A0A1R2B7X6_9CILI|nr:hypothetical protein SteCoe_28589 [Stentor coeruleus]
MSTVYIDTCSQKGIKPLKEVQKAIESHEDLQINSKVQLTDLDLWPIGSIMMENLDFLQQFEMTGQRVSENGIGFLCKGLQSNKVIKKLSLPRNGICSVESISMLSYALQNNTSVEVLDLSENSIEDSAAEALKELIRGNEILKKICLEHNLITSTCFAVSLCENNALMHFSVSYNPLSFENFISLLEMLNINTALQHLGLKGIKFSGPANIKENVSGVLTKQEAIILKLANVIRNSCLNSISIDLDPNATLQLRELETSLLKHNSFLTNISSDTINWRSSLQGPLLGIQKALKANSWLKKEDSSDEEAPYDLQNIIAAKKLPIQVANTLKNLPNALDTDYDKVLDHFSTDSPNFSSGVVTSPDFNANSPHLSEIKEPKDNRLTRLELGKKNQSEIISKKQVMMIFDDFSNKVQGFQDEILGQVNALQDRVLDLETATKSFNPSILLGKISELEKKDEATQNLLMLINRELAELKAQNSQNIRENSRDSKNQSDFNISNIEKKTVEHSNAINKLARNLEGIELKIQNFSQSPDKSIKYTKQSANSSKNYIERTSSKNSERGSLRNLEKDYEKNSIKNSEKNSIKNSEKNSIKNSERSSAKNSERNSAKNSERNSAKNSEKNSLRNSEECRFFEIGNETNGIRESSVDLDENVVFGKFPGLTESLVMKAIQEKNYWSVRKKLDLSHENSPTKPLGTFYSPEECPSRDLYQKLYQKGMNFISRSGSSTKKIYN